MLTSTSVFSSLAVSHNVGQIGWLRLVNNDTVMLNVLVAADSLMIRLHGEADLVLNCTTSDALTSIS